MANKRDGSEISEFAFKKIPIPKIRGIYRKFGTNIQIGRSKYTINICSLLFYYGKACDGLCDTVNKQIYIQYVKGGKKAVEAMEATLLHEVVHASLSESCVTQILEWSDHMEEIIVESLTRDLTSLYSIKVKDAFNPG